MTFEDLVKEYLENYSKPKSIKGIRSKINCHLLLKFKDLKLENITIKAVESLRCEMLEKRDIKKNSVINTVLKVLRAMLNKAKDYGYIDEVIPISKCFLAEDDSEEGKVIPDKDFWRIHKHAKSCLQRMMVVARLTSCRGHELRTLKWDCIKLGNNSKFKILPQFDKAKKGKESIITPELKVVFEALRKEKNGCEHVFNCDGKLITRNRMSEDFKKAYEEAGFKKGLYGFHDLRHTALTKAGENGVGIRTLMDLAGHHNPNTTAKYLHPNQNQIEKAMNGLTLQGNN